MNECSSWYGQQAVKIGQAKAAHRSVYNWYESERGKKLQATSCKPQAVRRSSFVIQTKRRKDRKGKTGMKETGRMVSWQEWPTCGGWQKADAAGSLKPNKKAALRQLSKKLSMISYLLSVGCSSPCFRNRHIRLLSARPSAGSHCVFFL